MLGLLIGWLLSVAGERLNRRDRQLEDAILEASKRMPTVVAGLLGYEVPEWRQFTDETVAALHRVRSLTSRRLLLRPLRAKRIHTAASDLSSHLGAAQLLSDQGFEFDRDRLLTLPTTMAKIEAMVFGEAGDLSDATAAILRDYNVH